MVMNVKRLISGLQKGARGEEAFIEHVRRVIVERRHLQTSYLCHVSADSMARGPRTGLTTSPPDTLPHSSRSSKKYRKEYSPNSRLAGRLVEGYI